MPKIGIWGYQSDHISQHKSLYVNKEQTKGKGRETVSVDDI